MTEMQDNDICAERQANGRYTIKRFNETSGECEPDEGYEGTYDESAVDKIGEDEGVDVWKRKPPDSQWVNES